MTKPHLIKTSGMGSLFLERDGLCISNTKYSDDSSHRTVTGVRITASPVEPLLWFEQDRPDFYQKYIVPLIVRYDLAR